MEHSLKSPAAPQDELSLSHERRLQFIDFRLQWDGKLNRTDLVEFFSISVPQASLEIKRYLGMFPGNMEYDRSTKSYVRLSTFVAGFQTSGPQQYLIQLQAAEQGLVRRDRVFFGFMPNAAVSTTAQRAADESVLRTLILAVRDRTPVQVSYQSITSDDPPNRVISPHAFAFDGRRWHVRAFCHLNNAFRDFAIGRLLAAEGSLAQAMPPETDVEWNTQVELVIAPHPELNSRQLAAIEADYLMENGRATLLCRRAMLYYVVRQLGLDRWGEASIEPKQIVLSNLAELRPYLIPQPSLGVKARTATR